MRRVGDHLIIAFIVIISAVIVLVGIYKHLEKTAPKPWTMEEVARARALCSAYQGEFIMFSMYEVYCRQDQVYFELPRDPKEGNYPRGKRTE